jgi:eukaryotic-like serine/threonine-protein kinase
MVSSTKNFLWILPFVSFIAGYTVMYLTLHRPETITPALVGKQIHTILPIVTEKKLNIRLIDQKEEADLPEGIILNQTPSAGITIKENQPLFIVTSKKPLPLRAPACVGQRIDTLRADLKTEDIVLRIYYIPHAYPENICFAQSPTSNEPLDNKKLVLYVSSGLNKPIIWPDFTGLSLKETKDFLDAYNLVPDIVNDHITGTDYTNYRVTDQRPFAGTILTLNEKKPLSVQLRIQAFKNKEQE